MYIAPSSSSRRTWIEIDAAPDIATSATEVVLLAEDVDRNMESLPSFKEAGEGRPPRGGRG